MARRKKNPTPPVLTLVIGAAVVGTGIYLWTKHQDEKAAQEKAAKKEAVPAPSYGTAEPTKPTTPKGKYAGTGWTDWPNKNWFDTLDSLGQGLDFAGYPVSYPPFKPLSAQAVAQIKQFQRDWNAVYDAHLTSRGAIGFRLTVDGKLGSKTIDALYWVTQLVADYDQAEWQDLVTESRKVLKES
jgi:hypothetical protein